MKTFIFISILISFSFLFSFNIFKPKPVVNNENYLTEEIESIYFQYEYPDTCITKNEPIYDSTYVKSDTIPHLEVRRRIKEDLDKLLSKNSTKNNGSLVGVFKSGSCGNNYPVLDIYLDCEDNGNPATQKHGWTGDSYVTTAKNVHLQFCIVNNANFSRTNFDYAVLMLDSWLPNSTENSIITRFMVNEKDGNTNITTIDNVDIYDSENSDGYIGDCFFGSSRFNGNSEFKIMTRLSFFYYPKVSNGGVLPDLGIDYGVLGRFGSQQGYIFLDNQNNQPVYNGTWPFNNPGYSNFTYKEIWSDDLFNHNDYEDENNIPNIMDVGSDTRLYISKYSFCSNP